MRRLNGQAWTTLVRLLFGVKVSDVDCGFKLFKREFTRDLQLNARGAMISTELMVKVAGAGRGFARSTSVICRGWRASNRAPIARYNARICGVVSSFWRIALARQRRLAELVRLPLRRDTHQIVH